MSCLKRYAKASYYPLIIDIHPRFFKEVTLLRHTNNNASDMDSPLDVLLETSAAKRCSKSRSRKWNKATWIKKLRNVVIKPC